MGSETGHAPEQQLGRNWAGIDLSSDSKARSQNSFLHNPSTYDGQHCRRLLQCDHIFFGFTHCSMCSPVLNTSHARNRLRQVLACRHFVCSLLRSVLTSLSLSTMYISSLCSLLSLAVCASAASFQLLLARRPPATSGQGFEKRQVSVGIPSSVPAQCTSTCNLISNEVSLVSVRVAQSTRCCPRSHVGVTTPQLLVSDPFSLGS